MFSKRRIAAAVLEANLDLTKALNKSLKLVQRTCPEEEFLQYRNIIGRILGEVYDIVVGVSRAYPELTPRGFKDVAPKKLKPGSPASKPPLMVPGKIREKAGKRESRENGVRKVAVRTAISTVPPGKVSRSEGSYGQRMVSPKDTR